MKLPVHPKTHPMSKPWLDWQPISSIPKNKDVLLGAQDGFYVVGKTNDGWQIKVATAIFYTSFFTHWAEIPEIEGTQ